MKYDEKYFEARLSGYGCQGGYSRMKDQIQKLHLGCLKRLGLGLEISNGKSALDVGCGYGYFCEILQSFGYEVYGTDISKHALLNAKNSARALGSKVALIIHDAQEPFPFKKNFNLITCFDTLEHLERPELTIQHCYNSLKSGGIFIAATPNIYSPYKLLFKDTTHINEKTIQDWRNIFSILDWFSLKTYTLQWIPIFQSLISQKRSFTNSFILNIPIFGCHIFFVAKKY